MINADVNDDPESPAGWAQIGYLHFSNDGEPKKTRYVWQWIKNRWNPSSEGGTSFFGSPNVGGVRNFRVHRRSDTGKLVMNMEGIEVPCSQAGVCPVTSFDPLNVWGGLSAQAFAEIDNLGGDMVGLITDTARWTSIKLKDPQDDWSAVSNTGGWSGGPSTCWWNRSVVDAERFDVWTYPLDHNC